MSESRFTGTTEHNAVSAEPSSETVETPNRSAGASESSEQVPEPAESRESVPPSTPSPEASEEDLSAQYEQAVRAAREAHQLSLAKARQDIADIMSQTKVAFSHAKEILGQAASAIGQGIQEQAASGQAAAAKAPQPNNADSQATPLLAFHQNVASAQDAPTGQLPQFGDPIRASHELITTMMESLETTMNSLPQFVTDGQKKPVS